MVTNAASEDLSVFAIAGDGSIELRHRVPAGAAPKSVAEHDGLVAVLHTGKPGVSAFRLETRASHRWSAPTRRWRPSDADPAQVAFTPDGSMVLITERGTDSIVSYPVTADGTLGAPREIASSGPTPYGFAFTSGGTLVVTEAFRAEKGAAAASSYAIVDGSIVPRTASVGNGRSEICWAVDHARRSVRVHDELRRRRGLALRDRRRRFTRRSRTPPRRLAVDGMSGCATRT